MAGRTQDSPPLRCNIVLGKKIRFLRLRKRLKQLDLALELGYESSGTVSQIENGIIGMKREKVFVAAKVLGVPAWVLFDDQEYTDDELSMYADFHDLMQKKDSQYYGAIKALLSQAAKD